MQWWPIVLGATAVIIVLLIGFFVTRWGVFDADDEEDGTDRINRSEQPQRELERIPLRDKHRQLTTPMKIILLCSVLLSLILSFYIYQFLKTGSPAEFQYVRELQFVVVSLIGVGGGVVFKDWADSRVARLEIDFEDTDGTDIDTTNTIYFLKQEAEPRDDGTIKVRALFPSLIVRLFPRKRLVGHDARLRSDRPLGKRITYEVPRHARELEDGFYVRTQGERVVGGAAQTDVDIRFTPPYELPYQSYVAQREQIEKTETRMESEQAMRAEAEAQLRRLKRLVENTEYKERDQIITDLERLQDIMQPTHEQITLQQPGSGRTVRGHGQTPQSQQQHHADGDGHRGGRDA